MQYGVCTDVKSAPMLHKAGFDFIEVAMNSLKPNEPEDAITENLRQMQDSAIPCRAANMFLPKDLPVTGPQVNYERLARYTEVACERARRAGIEAIVFGSGGARRVPDGFPRAAAEEQLTRFLSLLGPIAQKHGVVFVVEPLRQKECNIFNTVAECATFVEKADHPNVMLLVDAFHWASENEPAQSIVANGSLLRHAHVATYASRIAPGAEECDFLPFFQALKRAGYDGRLSIESKWTNMAEEAPRAIATLKRFAAQAGF